jgi:hypothetical protein
VDQPHDPRRYDVVICDLRRPVCYNSEVWLAAGRADSAYGEATAPPESYRRVSGALSPTFLLIRRDRMRVTAGRNFVGDDVLDAVTNAGLQVILFLNPEWIRHLGEEFPDWVALAWKFQKANVRKPAPDPVLKAALPEIESSLPLKSPLREQIVAGPLARSVAEISWDFNLTSAFQRRASGCRGRSLVGTRSGQSFSHLVRTGGPGRGAVWALPPFRDNTAVVRLLVSRLDRLNSIRVDAA